MSGAGAALMGGMDGRDVTAQCEGADARLECSRTEEAGCGRGAAMGGAAAQRERARAFMAVDELPQEEREEIDRLLSGGLAGYQQIADALQAKGFFIVKGAVGRYEAGRRAASERAP